MNKPRLSDIARAAGVSTATVSNALNHKNKVNQEKAEEIRRLAADMGYFPGAEGRRRSLRFIIYRKHGKVVMDTAFFAQLIEGVQEECRRLSCDLLINKVRAGDDVSALTDMPMLVLATEMDADDLAPYRTLKHPVLLLDSDFRFEPFSSVSIDNCEAGYLAGKHLIAHGHRRIGFLDSALPFNNMADRFAGLKAALDEAGLACAARVPLEPTVEGAERDMAAWLAGNRQLPTAFFAGNDIMAIGASMALKQAGFAIPQDVSLMGMDDMPVCLVVEPRLSTVRVDKQKLGMIAVDRLIAMMEEDERVYQRIRVSVSVTGRESVRFLPENVR
ncbi:MAG: LacI family DNA-binding transcriptional regulator [Clostridia bacterium]|nr:LacI family DNA-binding transcriptional regulator [Clostridia bacterium]